MHIGRYILQEDGTPIPVGSLEDYLSWVQSTNFDHHVAKDELPHCWVSTIYLGFDHGYGDDLPVLWETMIFKGRSFENEYTERYNNLADARAGHARAVELAKTMFADKPNPAPTEYASLDDASINELVMQRLAYIYDAEWKQYEAAYTASFDTAHPVLEWFESQFGNFGFMSEVQLELNLQNTQKPAIWRVRFTYEDWDYQSPQTVSESLDVQHRSLPRALCELFLKTHDYLENRNND